MTATGGWRRPVVLFTAAASLITVSCMAILRSRAFAGHPDVMAWAVTFDLTLTIPLLYYLVVIRTGNARPVTIIPVFAVCATFAAIVVPRGYQDTLHDLRFIVAPFEVITIALLVRRIAAMRRHSPEADPLARIEAAAQQALGQSRAADFVASEIAVVWYALFGWNREPDVKPGVANFTVHRRVGWGSVLACIVVLVISESIGLHLLVKLWSARAAWIVTSLDLYGLLWLFGDYNALRLRPSIVTADELRIRYGLRWSVAVPRTNVAAVRRTNGEADWKRRGVLKVAMLEDPRYMIELREPQVAKGLAGIRKTISAIAISPDDDDALTSWISGS
jgi:hypothetical protein